MHNFINIASCLQSTIETGAPVENGPRTSYIRRLVDDLPMKIELRRASTVAIPESHRSFPHTIEVVIEPMAFRHSPKTHSHGSPGATYHSSDSSLPDMRSTSFSMLDSKAVYSPATEGDLRPTTESASVWSSDNSSATAIQNPAVMWPFEEAIVSRRPVHVPNLPGYVVEGLEMRGWGEPAREAVVIPVVVDDANLPCAVLVMGLNSRRGYDSEYESWIDLVRLSLNSLMTAVKGREADLIRAEYVIV